MMDNELKEIVNNAKDFHRGYICRYGKRVLLPLLRFKPAILAKTKRGPQPLDAIFFGLLGNNITTPKKIAAWLGVEEDSFIFSHLNALMRAGYVAFVNGEYRLTGTGGDFASGRVEEESWTTENFPFIWNEINEKIGPEDISPRDLKNHTAIKHQKFLDENTLLNALVPRFNEEFREQGLAFYDIDSTGWLLRGKRCYAKYVALFYEAKTDEGDWLLERVDIRVQNEKYELCEDTTASVNGNEYWRRQFEEIYKKICGNSPESAPSDSSKSGQNAP